MTSGVQTTRPTIKEGSNGQDVNDLQQVLNMTVASPELVVDGVFGAKTKEAVIAFQKQQNLTPDGIVGPQTWSVVDTIEINEREPGNLPILRRGDAGEDVKYLQQRLKIWGSSLGIDGVFGANTEAEVKKFQTQYGLTVDGVVGTQTWTNLLRVED